MKQHTRKKVPSPFQYLYPKIKPFYSHRLKVSDIYTIPIWVFGNPKGKPVLFIHGGPGAGTTFDDARFFNPKKYYIILVDQRGCGKGTPLANGVDLKENTTKDLISDFEKVRNHLQIKKWMIFGGSWGSTLSLAYSMTHPNRVTEIVLRGIFFCTKRQNDWLADPSGASRFHPEAWKYYEESLPNRKKYKGDYIKGFEKCFSGAYGKTKKKRCLLAWASWEDSNAFLRTKPIKEVVRETKKDPKGYKSIASIENHYFKNNCFLEKDYFKKSNFDKIRHIPIIIVQGLYDMICTFEVGYMLHKALPHATFYPTMAGHSSYDPENTKHLVIATNTFS